MIPRTLIDQCQQAFDDGFDSVETTWRQSATVGEPVSDFRSGCQTHGVLCHNPTAGSMARAGRSGAQKINKVVAEAGGPVVIRFLNGQERPQLEFFEEDGAVVVRCYLDFGVEATPPSSAVCRVVEREHSRFELASNGYCNSAE